MMSSNIGVLQTEYPAEEICHVIHYSKFSVGKGGIRMKSIMAACDCPYVDPAVEVAEGSDANRQQPPRGRG